MKQYVTSVCVFAGTLIFLIALCVLSCSAKMTSFLNQKQEGLIITRGIEGLDDAKRVIQNDLELKVREASNEAYLFLTESIYNKGIEITEEEATEIYRKTVLKIVREKYGMVGNTEDELSYELELSIDDELPRLKTGELSVNYDVTPYLELKDNKIYLNNVTVDFAYGNSYNREINFDVFAKVSNMVFYDENAELFTYCMAADKGIYITGKTSTIIGNIYAGTHSPAELRKAEALYGETGSYGGVNIMSTQLAVEADKIVTDGVVNMKGAFAVFGNESHPIEILADGIVETDNVANKNIYALFGNVNNGDISIEKSKVRESMKYLGSIDVFYDSNNDKCYIGEYRKIISSTDITVTSDVTGIIMTPANVIIEEGVNVEGLILSGDRIYIQGNNNIVSSVEVLRKILKEELYQDIYLEYNSVTDEERALNSIHLMMKDYFGGIRYRGIEE